MQKKAMEESRLGIPILFGHDVIHGYRTIFPIPLAQACSWNPELARLSCEVSAREAASSGVDWTFSPMVDVARDPRWGRVMEGYGEDVYTNSVFCEAAVRGYQGDDLSDPNSIAACLKHYVGYGASEAGRDYVPTEISDQTLWDTYLPPFEAGVKAGDIVSVDVGAFWKGFHGDCAATFACGDISPEAQRLIDTTRESLYEGIKMARAGGRIGDISFAIQSYVEARGYSVVRDFVGHGVGTSLHEAPEVPNFGTAGRGVRLLPGMTLAIEPMVNMGKYDVKVMPDGWTVKTSDGKLSAHFEHTIAITSDGPLIMTRL